MNFRITQLIKNNNIKELKILLTPNNRFLLLKIVSLCLTQKEFFNKIDNVECNELENLLVILSKDLHDLV
jgi:hypothetical protein